MVLICWSISSRHFRRLSASLVSGTDVRGRVAESTWRFGDRPAVVVAMLRAGEIDAVELRDRLLSVLTARFVRGLGLRTLLAAVVRFGLGSLVLARFTGGRSVYAPGKLSFRFV